MKGELVILKYHDDKSGTDPFNNDIYELISKNVDNVLVQPGIPENDIESNRPEGVVIKYTLQFPKDFVYGVDTEIFRGAIITVRGKDYKVVGSPDCFDSENCPTEWCMPVYVEDSDG